MRIGHGWDSHRLVPQRPLMLGGIEINTSELGEDGHSDGDVLLHAIIDALLGAATLGDIGTHFPPSDDTWKDADGMRLLCLTYEKIQKSRLVVGNIDATVILESPRLAKFIPAIKNSIAEALDMNSDSVSVKAKSAEGLGPVGALKSIEAHAVVLLSDEPQEMWV